MMPTLESWWPALVLAVLLVVDAGMSVRPPRFIRDCLTGVGFPRPWWWVLIVVKTLAAVGLVAGLWFPGVALAVGCGVVAYFYCAAAAHVRARFFGQAFWLNCLGMLVVSIVVTATIALHWWPSCGMNAARPINNAVPTRATRDGWMRLADDVSVPGTPGGSPRPTRAG